MLRAKVTAPAVAAVAVLAFAGPASAESGPPGVWAAAAQYVEMIPTSTGPKTAGAAGRSKPLSKSLAREFARRGGNDAQALATLVTSSGWGTTTTAPRKPHATPERKPKPALQPPPATEERQAAKLVVPLPQETMSLPASVGAGLTSGGRARFAVVALLCLVAAFTLARLRRGRSSE